MLRGQRCQLERCIVCCTRIVYIEQMLFDRKQHQQNGIEHNEQSFSEVMYSMRQMVVNLYL